MRITLAKQLRVITDDAEAKYRKNIDEKIAAAEVQDVDEDEDDEVKDKKDIAYLRKAIRSACKEAAGFRVDKLSITWEGSDSLNIKRHLKNPEIFNRMFVFDTSGSDYYEWLSPIGMEVLRSLRLRYSVSDDPHFCHIIIKW